MNAEALTEIPIEDGGVYLPVAANPAVILKPGAIVGRYIIKRLIGAGGVGVVYEAFDPQLQRRIALKLLRSDRSSTDAWQARLLREAQVMAQLSHPNVVNIFDAGTFNGLVFIAMEYVDGSTLSEWLRAKNRPPSEILEKFIEAGRGLVAAHAANLVHRDFKPQNVLLGTDGRPRVTDFGLARPITTSANANQPTGPTETTEMLTETSLMGSPAYMAPEQFLRQPIDTRTDQFSFCVSLYEALQGVRPFDGKTDAELATAVVTGAIRHVSKLRLTPRMHDILRRGLSVRPKERYPSMKALLSALTHPSDGRAPQSDHPVSRKSFFAVGTATFFIASLAVAFWGTRFHRPPRLDEAKQALTAPPPAPDIETQNAKTAFVPPTIRHEDSPVLEARGAPVQASPSAAVSHWSKRRRPARASRRQTPSPPSDPLITNSGDLKPFDDGE